MDAPTKAIVDYAMSLSYGDLTEPVISSTVRHVLDAASCALGGFASEPANVARDIASTASSEEGASVLGLASTTTPEYATFANTAMVRYLDYNDAGPPGHASDMIPGIFAVAESCHASGRDLIRAVVASYEVCRVLYRDGEGFHQLVRAGVDQVWAGVGVAVGAGLILDLSPDQLAHAVSLAVVPSVPLRVTRTGVLSHWKGCATAHGAMNAVFGARLAKRGMTAPAEPFDGIDGFARLSGYQVGPMDDLGKPVRGLSAVESTAIKFFPAEYGSQGPISTILEMAKKIDSVDDIEHVQIATFWGNWSETGGGQGDREIKWNPTTRETADHSQPYLMAVALTDGAVTVDSFTPERILDPSLRSLMQKISVVHDPELTRQFAEEGYFLSSCPAIITIQLKGGVIVEERTAPPKGSPANPMSDQELEAKFRSTASRVVTQSKAERLLSVLWELEDLPDVNELANLFRSLGR